MHDTILPEHRIQMAIETGNALTTNANDFLTKEKEGGSCELKDKNHLTCKYCSKPYIYKSDHPEFCSWECNDDWWEEEDGAYNERIAYEKQQKKYFSRHQV